MKKCTKCGEVKELTEYSTESRAKDGRRSACKVCLSSASSLYYKNKEYKYSAEFRRRQTLAEYGLTLEDYNIMLEGQDHKCKICGIEEKHSSKARFHVDHCHETGMVRGLLCSKCNTGLGMFRDNSEFLREAAKYLEEAE